MIRISLRTATAVGALAMGAALAAGPALADTPAVAAATPAAVTPAAPATAQPSQNAVINLIRLLVKQGVLTQKQADGLVAEAEAEAAQARQSAGTQTATAAPVPPPPAPGTIRVPYVPESVKKQIADNVRQEVLDEVQKENWAKPEAVPEWTKHVKVGADLRVRNESDLYSSLNDPGIVDFATFNSTGPIDTNDKTNATGFPILNSRVNRPYRALVRGRLNVGIDVTPGVFFDMRIASGQSNSPVSTNQILGGGLSKKALWLDQAYVTLTPDWWGSLTLGRMPDPFFHTELVYDDDLNFDGLALSFLSQRASSSGFNMSATAGIFPIEYGDSNFPTYSTAKTRDEIKWMAGGQLVASYKEKDWDWKFGVSYYDFQNVRGQLSSPCTPYNGPNTCDTDQTRPAFMQKGNTLFLLRNIVPNPADPLNSPLPQFVGLSFDYNILNATTQLDFAVGSHYQLSFLADYARNLAFNPASAYRQSPLALPINNVRANVPVNDPSALQSGPNGAQGKITFGYPNPSELWEWNVSVGYRYVQPDAVLDAFTDSDFHLGGTNARGYIVGGSLGLFHNTALTARWMSGNEVYGTPLAIDVFQLDLTTGF